jgi:hypothetical protein
MSGDHEIYYEGERIDSVRAAEIAEIQAQQTRRSAEINCHVVPGRRWGRAAVVLTLMGAGFGIEHEPVLRRDAVRPAKHWVARKDWTQREKRRPRR